MDEVRFKVIKSAFNLFYKYLEQQLEIFKELNINDEMDLNLQHLLEKLSKLGLLEHEVAINDEKFGEHSTGQGIYNDSDRVNLSFNLNEELQSTSNGSPNFIYTQEIENAEAAVYSDIGKSLVCEICGKVMPSKAKLELHSTVHTGKRDFLCEFCSKTFKNPHHLKRHIWQHTDEMPFNCSKCDTKFRDRHQMKSHMKKFHNGPPKFQCHICKEFVHRKQQLKEHLIRHNNGDIKIYKCEVCGCGCKTKQHLTYHMRVHTGERPFQCEFCGVSFAQDSHLSVHRQNHVKEKNFVCDICDRKYKTAVYLKNHKKRMHKSKSETKLK